jgi:intracellular multiplication protein IcmL
MFFKKKTTPDQKTVIASETASENEPLQTKDVRVKQNDSAAPDAATLIGGLGWYRAQYGRAMKLAVGLIIALCIALAVIVLLVLTRQTPRYFAATPDLRLAPLVPLDKPLLTQAGLLNWTTTTITGAVSLDFLEWRAKLTSVRENFESEAFSSFVTALKSSGILDMIKEKRLSASAVVTRAPVIIASGLVGGKSTWKIEFPLIVSYESSQGVESTQRLMATVLVCRDSTVTTPRGVVIQQVVLKRDS